MTSDSSDTEPSTVSSPQAKRSKRKTVKKLKCKKDKIKIDYDSSADESNEIPKKKRKVKKLRRVPKLKKQCEKRESKTDGKKCRHSLTGEHKECKEHTEHEECKVIKGKDNIEEMDIGAIRTVTGGGRVLVDVNEWVRLMEYVQ